MRAAAFGPRQRGLRHHLGDRQHVAQIEPVESAADRTAAVADRARRRARCSSSSMPSSARLSFASVRNGPTSSAIVACSAASMAAVLMSRRSTVAAQQIERRACRRGLERLPVHALARDRRRVRPAWRPNTNASVMALPERRLAPLAPPTASPATNRPGTSVCHARVRDDAAHVIVRDRRHLDRHLGEIDAVRRQPVDHRTEGRAQFGFRADAGTTDRRRRAASRGRPRPP